MLFSNLQHINRMLYRARQRGWLELDLLVGMWAERQVHNLSKEKLRDLEILLDQVRFITADPRLYSISCGYCRGEMHS